MPKSDQKNETPGGVGRGKLMSLLTSSKSNSEPLNSSSSSSSIESYMNRPSFDHLIGFNELQFSTDDDEPFGMFKPTLHTSGRFSDDACLASSESSAEEQKNERAEYFKMAHQRLHNMSFQKQEKEIKAGESLGSKHRLSNSGQESEGNLKTDSGKSKKGLLNSSSPKQGEGNKAAMAYKNLLGRKSTEEKDIFNISEDDSQSEYFYRADYSIGHVIRKMEKFCGIIHGNIQCELASDISKLQLNPHISSVLLQLKTTEFTRSQMYGIPVLLQRRNLILVGPQSTGKTFACVIAMMSILMDEDYIHKLEGNGPSCVFLCANSKNVTEVELFFIELHSQKESPVKLRILTAHGGGLEKERKNDLANGCDILITTPRCWLRLLQARTMTNMNRLCHIVFDDSEILFDTFKFEIKIILRCFRDLLEKRLKDYKKSKDFFGVHVAVVGSKWTSSHDDCLNVLEKPVVAITSPLEAALYSRIKPITCIISSSAKVPKLLDLLEKSKDFRTVIMCNSTEEVMQLRLQLPFQENKYLVAHEEMGYAAICEIGKTWTSECSPKLLLCSDPKLAELGVTNAQHLIHFSLPANKSYFSERFSTIQDYYVDRINNPESKAPQCYVNILLDTNNVCQFPEIISFLKRLKTPIPKNVEKVVNNIKRQKEELKSELPFCEDILMFGNCRSGDRCTRCHILIKERDTPESLPLAGLVKMKLLHIHNPSHYSVRIIALKEKENDPWGEFESHYGVIGFKMANYFRKYENRIPHGKVQLGDIVAVKDVDDPHFKRGIVTEILSRNDENVPVSVLVRSLDEGSSKRYKDVALYHLPPELQIYKPEAYDVYLSNIQPVDFDPKWSLASILLLRMNYYKATEDVEDNFFVAKVELTIGINMVVSSFLCYEWLEMNKCFCVLFSPRKFILNSRLADTNDEHLPSLIELAREAGLIPEQPMVVSNSGFSEKLEEENKLEENVEWDHLEEDVYVSSYVSSFVSPSLFYLHKKKNFYLLSGLEKDLTDALKQGILKPVSICEKMLCAIRNPESNEWNRAMILEVLGDKVEAFCVDHGDTLPVPVSEVSLLPQGFISRLPLQAIECSLIGIVPTDLQSGWETDSLDFFEELICSENGDMKILHTRVCEVTDPKITSGKHHKVLLLDASGENDVLLNKEFIINALANWANDSTKVYLKDKSFLNFVREEEIESQETEKIEESDNDTLDENDLDSPSDTDSDPAGIKEVWTEESTTDHERVNRLNEISRTINSTEFTNILEALQNGDFEIHGGETLKEYSKDLVNYLPVPLRNSFQYAIEGPLTDIKEIKSEGLSVEETIVTESREEIITKEVIDEDSLGGAVVKKKIEKSILSTSIKDGRTKNIQQTLPAIESGGSGDAGHLSAENNLILLEKAISQDLGQDLEVFHPSIVWSQTDFTVKISVMLPDIKNYLVFCCYQHVIFKCIVNERIYAFELRLFGPVNKDTIQYIPLGLYFEIKMQKVMPGEWPRLVYQRDLVCPWIRRDLTPPAQEDIIEKLLQRAEHNMETPEEYERRMELRKGYAANSYVPEAGYEDFADPEFEDSDSDDFDLKDFYYKQ